MRPLRLDEFGQREGPVGRTLPSLQDMAGSGILPDCAAELPPSFQAGVHAQLAWLRSLDGLSDAAALLLAARTTGMVAASRRSAPAQSHPLTSLLAGSPQPAALAEAAAALPGGAGCRPLTECDLASLARLWQLAAPTAALLASGGDDRLILDGYGLNRYGCAPQPRPAVVSFGSCTASSPSPGAFAAAEQARRSLMRAALATGFENAIAAAGRTIADAVLDAFTVADLAEAILTASGTDAALVITSLLAAEHPATPMTSVLVSPAETGSGVPNAVQGRHFADLAASGCRVSKGQPVDGLDARPTLVTVALRDDDGQPLAIQAVGAACEAAIIGALRHGRVVLHAIDGSKTGLTAPGRADLVRLASRFGPALDIVIDACQARIEPALVRWYLQQGFPVLITGSKFFGAPGFCGAVLFPHARLERIVSTACFPAGLASYARLDGGLGSRNCPGLLLRWTAALHEMDRFFRLPPGEILRRLERIGTDVRAVLRREAGAELMQAPRPDGPGWSDQASVFTFALRSAGGWKTMAELRSLYAELQQDMSGSIKGVFYKDIAALRCQIGQPVQLGTGQKGGLRIAISAAQIAQGEDHRVGLDQVASKLRILLTQGAH